MTTIKNRIVKHFQANPAPIDDDDLAKVLGLKSRQEANQYCRELARQGYLNRVKIDGKLQNIWNNSPYQVNSSRTESVQEEMSKEEYQTIWYWEGNVQDQVINYLQTQGYEIVSFANTRGHERGIDIVAINGDKELWVTVKGYPRKKVKTNPRLQCVHWFAAALYDIIKYRERNSEVELAFALPNFDRYRNLVKEMSWFKDTANFSFYWVSEDGYVEKQ